MHKRMHHDSPQVCDWRAHTPAIHFSSMQPPSDPSGSKAKLRSWTPMSENAAGCLPSVVTWTQPHMSGGVARRPRPVVQQQKKERLTASQRMRQRLPATRFMQEQCSSSNDSSPANSPMQLRKSAHLSPPSYAKFGSGTMWEVPTLEQLCLSTIASRLVRLHEGCMDLVPDYLRYALFESVRQRNPLLLHGQTLRALVCGTHS
jgi:hypothetical protein